MDVFIARQPIFNRARQVYGYELLFRSSEKNVFSFENPDWASVKVLDNAFLLFGIEALTGGKRAFVNFTRDTLIREYALGCRPSC